jgi:hypothetical protein
MITMDQGISTKHKIILQGIEIQRKMNMDIRLHFQIKKVRCLTQG